MYCFLVVKLRFVHTNFSKHGLASGTPKTTGLPFVTYKCGSRRAVRGYTAPAETVSGPAPRVLLVAPPCASLPG